MSLIFLLFFTFFISTNVFSKECNCPGIVEYCEIVEDYYFTGLCDKENNRKYGNTDIYIDGVQDTYSGYYDDQGRRFRGVYNFGPGEYEGATWYGENIYQNYRYDFIGKYTYANGNTITGYFKNDELNGFGLVYIKESETLIAGFSKDQNFDGDILIADGEDGETIFGFAENEELQGYAYIEYDDNRKGVRFYKDDFQTGEEKIFWSPKDREAKNEILENIQQAYNLFNIRYDEIDQDIQNYYTMIAKDNLQLGEGETASRLLIQSIQELLKNLYYQPDEPNGIMGEKTIAAIKAFKRDNKLSVNGIANQELLVDLQSAFRKQNLDETARSSDLIDQDQLLATGTGFYVNNNTIVTNSHVINKCNSVSDKEQNNYRILVNDRANDVAILKSDGNSYDFLSLGKDPKLGENIFVAGYPLSGYLESLNFTSGNVSSLIGLGQDITQFQFTAPIQPGNSGGPILNGIGVVTGITVATASEVIEEVYGVMPQNINFGIKVGLLKQELELNDINFYMNEEKATRFNKLSEAVIAERARRSTVLLTCFGIPEEKKN
jgi:hypothetical protein